MAMSPRPLLGYLRSCAVSKLIPTRLFLVEQCLVAGPCGRYRSCKFRWATLVNRREIFAILMYELGKAHEPALGILLQPTHVQAGDWVKSFGSHVALGTRCKVVFDNTAKLGAHVTCHPG